MRRGSIYEICNGLRGCSELAFSDLSGFKIRPAIVVVALEEDNYILCQVTSQSYHEADIELNEQGFESGSLKKKSFILYTQLFTADSTGIQREVARLNGSLCEKLISTLKDTLDVSLKARLRG